MAAIEEASKAEEAKKEPKKEETSLDLSVFKNLVDLVHSATELDKIEPQISSHLTKLISSSELRNYTVLFLYDPEGNINDSTADRLYNAVPKNDEQNILLILHSGGGSIEPAYLVSKCCKEFSSKFVVSIPRKAKSAATLIALGADEIHMGTMSELGPIDPQFGGLPALGLSSAIEHLARLCKEYPESSDMFAKYLSLKLDLRMLGYFERVSESAVQYAERLLKGKKFPKRETENSIANRFVYSYKDHSFVIDKDEAKQCLGDHVKTGTKEYALGNDVHNFMEMLNICTDIFKDNYAYIFGGVNGIGFARKEKK